MAPERLGLAQGELLPMKSHREVLLCIYPRVWLSRIEFNNADGLHLLTLLPFRVSFVDLRISQLCLNLPLSHI